MPDARRLRLTLAYDGSGFRGWAAQPGLRTVEGAVREALEKTFASAQGLAVAGRTDTGVHAIANVAGVDVEGGPPAAHAAQALNTVLPSDVAAIAAQDAAPDFHARFSARLRSYRYRIWCNRLRSPFEVGRAWWHPRPLDVERLQAQTPTLLGRHDFRAFTPTETQHKVFVRTVEHAQWIDEGDVLTFEITADSFLRHMVRTIVGTMVDGVDLAPLLEGRARADAAQTAPASGLYLTGVAYD